MNAIEAIQATSSTSDMVLKSYVSDLSDVELMMRPHAGCNHLAWQLGHLIASEVMLLQMIQPDASIDLPEGFAEKYSKETVGDDDPSHFHTRDEYLELYDRVRTASREAIGALSEADLDGPNKNERMKERFPTIGSVCVLAATHPMMHVGQFVPVRRAASKPVVI